mmetsp:Transcript_7594/g.11702  ORF Transcript_7594/g.11702 Transcript_7594/m.11702 type:complete len:203 (+) Transcript_7594:165-773(+)
MFRSLAFFLSTSAVVANGARLKGGLSLQVQPPPSATISTVPTMNVDDNEPQTMSVTCDVFVAGNRAENIYEGCSQSTVNSIMEDFTTSSYRIISVDTLAHLDHGTRVEMSLFPQDGLPRGDNNDEDIPIPDAWRLRKRLLLEEDKDEDEEMRKLAGLGGLDPVVFREMYNDGFATCLHRTDLFHDAGIDVTCSGHLSDEPVL